MGLDDILAAARRRPAKGNRGHSALYEWMWERADTLASELDPPRRPNWTAMAEQFSREGVVDGQGQAPGPETVRKTWWKVRKDRRRQAAGEGVRQAPPRRAVTPPPPPLEANTPAAVQAGAVDENEPARPRFGFATVRK